MQDYSYASGIQRISAFSYHNPTENISCADVLTGSKPCSY